MKTLSKIKAIAITGAALATGASAQSYYDFSRLAVTLTNMTEVLSVLGTTVIPAILPVIVALAILSAIVSAITIGVGLLMGWLKIGAKGSRR